MSEMTNIEWCDSTFNPFIGCTKISPGCDNCYAENLMDHRMHKVKWGAGQERIRTSAANWRKPIIKRISPTKEPAAKAKDNACGSPAMRLAYRQPISSSSPGMMNAMPLFFCSVFIYVLCLLLTESVRRAA